MAPSAFGVLLRQERLAHHLTQEELAERARLSARAISDLERGIKHTPRLTTLRLLVAALELDLDAAQALMAAARDHGDPARGPALARHNLPAALSSLIGREETLVELMRRLAASRLVTLAGVGGCGKTRLALEAAGRVVATYPDGVWLVELGAVTDPGLVPHRVAAVVGAPDSPQQSLESSLTSWLSSRRLLLVMDNCEHLLDACARLLHALLRACPELQVLATSREALGIEGEVAWRVPSLAVPDLHDPGSPAVLAENPSVQLFVERARAIQSNFALADGTAAAIAQVCCRLDGIPLALEMAAARIEALTAKQIAQRLDQRFRLLTAGSRMAMPRQQTLQAALDWSFDLLRRPERRLLERLSVFAGGWSLEAAEAVCSGHDLPREEVVDCLAQLVRKSLVNVAPTDDEGARYRLLETVREYARQKLAARGSAGVVALRERHAEFYMRWVEERTSARKTAWHAVVPATIDMLVIGERTEQLDLEYDNLRAVLAWTVDMGRPTQGLRLAEALYEWYWRSGGLYAEASGGAEALLGVADHAPKRIPPDLRGRALWIVGTVATRRGEYALAVDRLQQSVTTFRDVGEPLQLANALSLLGLAVWLTGDDDRAVSVLEESLQMSRSQRVYDAVGITSQALRNLGLLARARGDYRRAAELFHESGARAQALVTNDDYPVPRATAHLVRVCFLQGSVGRARDLLREAMAMMRQSRLAGHTLADALDWLAAVEASRGDPLRAARLFGAAERQWQVSGAVRYGPERPAYARDVDGLRGVLAEHLFTAAWAEGHAMNAEHAIAYALDAKRGG